MKAHARKTAPAAGAKITRAEQRQQQEGRRLVHEYLGKQSRRDLLGIVRPWFTRTATAESLEVALLVSSLEQLRAMALFCSLLKSQWMSFEVELHWPVVRAIDTAAQAAGIDREEFIRDAVRERIARVKGGVR